MALWMKILKQVAAVDVDKELENLSRGQAIKDNKHKQQIVDLIEDTKHALMDLPLLLVLSDTI